MLTPEQELIIDRAQHPQFAGELPEATHVAEGANLSCGDEIRYELRLDETGAIQEIRHQARACSICLANADLLAEYAASHTLEEIKTWNPSNEIARLNVPLSPIRQKCATLPLETLKLAIKKGTVSRTG